MEKVTETLSRRHASFDEGPRCSDNSQSRRSSKKCELEEYSESTTAALYDVFHSSAYLPCTCSAKRSVTCLSTDYVCALRLDGNQHAPDDDNYHFFDSVISGRNDSSHQLTPVRFHLPR
jgi:hypothetical protein